MNDSVHLIQDSYLSVQSPGTLSGSSENRSRGSWLHAKGKSLLPSWHSHHLYLWLW